MGLGERVATHLRFRYGGRLLDDDDGFLILRREVFHLVQLLCLDGGGTEKTAALVGD